jgi:hypothetical protein
VITCEIEIPRNQSSVKMGRYFEVKYFIDIGVCTPAAYVRPPLPQAVNSHLTGVQSGFNCLLPLFTWWVGASLQLSQQLTSSQNSLDIIPNVLKDVTAAIAERYGADVAKSYLAGRAFTAPREQAAAAAGLPQPLVPTLQPRKASVRQKQSEDTGQDDNGGLGFDVAAFFDEVGETRKGRDEELVDARPPSSVGAGRGSRRMTTREMLKQLEGLKA